MIQFHPLVARLKHYRFSWLMVGASSLDTGVWRPANLHRLPDKNLNPWERMLIKSLPVTAIQAPYPLVSASLKRLKKIRLLRPHRALVWLTPASPLIKPNPQLQELGRPIVAFEGDHQFPLIWSNKHPIDIARNWAPILPVRADPRRLELQRLRSRGQTVWADEAGQLIIQEQFLEPPDDGSLNLTAWSEYDAVVASLITHHRTYVIARKRRSLIQFARDVLRMGSVRIRVLFAPDWPLPDDPQPRIVALTLDQARALRYPRPWPVIHLDHMIHTWHVGPRKWIEPITVDVTRIVHINGTTVVGQRSRFGWHLAFTDCAHRQIRA